MKNRLAMIFHFLYYCYILGSQGITYPILSKRERVIQKTIKKGGGVSL